MSEITADELLRRISVAHDWADVKFEEAEKLATAGGPKAQEYSLQAGMYYLIAQTLLHIVNP
jgi:hypothetical protein